MRDDLGSVDVKEFCRAQLLKRAVEAAEADCASCVVSHAKVLWESASQRRRRELAQVGPQKVVKIR